ncbi:MULTISPECIES: dihydropteroate synthase [unclassified Amycolatopsis]|uniref:dihydropteroate synthase n=1 Tax=unclassified Amycolatopsis TaxID=2618356 RepID=UPI001C6A83E9|nr:dihydropteroate synthase [Amycolatopsis sp. DSM 110486]QYN20210.1 dihydropteroate synthase [Amycolatopsis sp. DSM 110486]
MGILNVTPDSFSDGGAHPTAAHAIEHGLRLVADGAHIIDVGGESTRPGATRVSAREETARVRTVVRELTAAGAVVSIDTTKASVARIALDAGATIVNDVSGGLADPELVRCVAEADVPYVATHWRGPSKSMGRHAVYEDVVTDVVGELARRRDALLGAGVAADRLVLDPGLGFAKDAPHDWQLLGHLGALRALGHPVLVGASRKRFLGAALAAGGRPVPPPVERDIATAAVSFLAATAGVHCVRVHDVRATLDALHVAEAVLAHTRPPVASSHVRDAGPSRPGLAGRSAPVSSGSR